MKRIACGLLAVLAAVICLTGCAGMADWASKPLAGNYEIWRMSAHNIVLLERDCDSGGRIVLGPEIYAVAWSDDWILLQTEEDPGLAQVDREPHGALDYYILLVDGQEILGPFDEAGFSDACRKQGIPVPEQWTPVRELPRRSPVR